MNDNEQGDEPLEDIEQQDTAEPAQDELAAAPQSPQPDDDITVAETPPLAKERGGGSAFMGVPIEVTISVGKARPLVNELVKLRRDSVIGLDTKIDDPVEVYIGDKLIARGELEELEDSGGQLAVRLTEVADISGSV